MGRPGVAGDDDRGGRQHFGQATQVGSREEDRRMIEGLGDHRNDVVFLVAA